MANINEFKTRMTGGGARSNQFRVTFNAPSAVSNTEALRDVTFLCKAAQLPGLTVDNIPVTYRGRVLNFAGEKTFAPWTVSIYNDTNFRIRNMLEDWSSYIQENSSTRGTVNPSEYQVPLIVEQLDRNDGAALKTINFFDAYPTDIGAIGLDYDTASIEVFDVTFTYNYWTSTTGALV
jgi:hypothetical protein